MSHSFWKSDRFAEQKLKFEIKKKNSILDTGLN